MKRYLKSIILISVLSLLFNTSFAQQAFVIYNKKGEVASVQDIIKDTQGKSHVFFGEYHNNPISHWVRMKLIGELYEIQGKNLVIGAEMFEADNQILLDEYLKDIIQQNNFESEARTWTNYKTDYKPMVEFAKKNELSFIATNIPRRYANIVYHKGLEILNQLSPEAHNFMAPLPIVVDTTLSTYRDIKKMAGGHGGDNLVYSQAVKDATMAHFILKNSPANSLFFHVNGSYHSDQYQGIISFLKSAVPLNKILTITTVSQKDVNKLEEKNKILADYIICVDAQMTTTH